MIRTGKVIRVNNCKYVMSVTDENNVTTAELCSYYSAKVFENEVHLLEFFEKYCSKYSKQFIVIETTVQYD